MRAGRRPSVRPTVAPGDSRKCPASTYRNRPARFVRQGCSRTGNVEQFRVHRSFRKFQQLDLADRGSAFFRPLDDLLQRIAMWGGPQMGDVDSVSLRAPLPSRLLDHTKPIGLSESWQPKPGRSMYQLSMTSVLSGTDAPGPGSTSVVVFTCRATYEPNGFLSPVSTESMVTFTSAPLASTARRAARASSALPSPGSESAHTPWLPD